MSSLALVFDLLAKDRASKEFDKVGDAADKAGKKGAAFGKMMGAGLAAAAAVVAEFGKKSVEAAIEGQQAHAQLAQAIKNTGGSMEELEPKINAMSDRFTKFGYTNDEVEKALTQMTTSLGSSSKAMGAMDLAADLAKSKHIDLAQASLTVAKAMEGQLRPLKQLGIDLPVSAGGAQQVAVANDKLRAATARATSFLSAHKDAVEVGSKSHAKYQGLLDKVNVAQAGLSKTEGTAKQITDALSKAVGGQASASADTYAGKIAAMHAKMENLTEQVGNKLLPILSGLIDKVVAASGVFERNKAVLGPLITVVASMAAAIFVVNKAVVAWRAAQAALNVVLAANPIGLVIVALAALALGLIYAYKHSQTFRDIVNTAFRVVAQGVSFLLDKIGDLFGALGHVPGFGWAKSAASAMHGAAGAASGLASSINSIPRDVQIRITTTRIENAADDAARKKAVAGKRAGGGPVTAGRAYVVGELEPELFVPRTDGTILNQKQMAGMTGGRTSNITINTLEAPLDEARLGNVLRQMELLHG